MKNQFESIRQLKEQGVSIRDIAELLSITKYEVEKALLQLKAVEDRPDSCLDGEPDNYSDKQTRMAGQEMHYINRSNSIAVPKAPKDMPSEWNPNCTRYEADLVIEIHLKGYEPYEIKSIYEQRFSGGFLALSDIQRVIEVYEREEKRKKAIEADHQKITDLKLVDTFNNFVGEDISAFLLWLDQFTDWNETSVKACSSRAVIILGEIESFCRTHDLAYRDYEPYLIVSSIKDTMAIKARKRSDTPDFDDKVITFISLFIQRPNLDRYLYKLLEKGRTRYSNW